MTNPFRPLLKLSLLMLPLCTMNACAGNPPPSLSNPTTPKENPSSASVPVSTSDSQSPPSAISGNLSISTSINEFAINLYTKLSETEKGNLFFSPYSIASALAMTYAGARGNTATEMENVLHFAGPQVHAAFSQLEKQLTATASGKWLVANRLWVQKGGMYTADFIDLLLEFYGAGVKSVNFTTATEEARRTINGWVEEKTEKEIKELLTPGILTPQTKLVLTNAVYFKGAWGSPFEEKNTKPAPFQVSVNKPVEVPMMVREGQFKYVETGEVQIVELPYGQKNDTQGLSMVVMLPKKVGMEGLSTVEKSLKSLLGSLQNLEYQSVEVHLPKFTLTAAFQLKESLAKLGMKEAFNRDKADFSGITGKSELSVSEVVHKAFVEVNEKGTTAAAATGVTMMSKGISAPPVIFLADHPFVFVIRERPTGTVLFVGRVVEPSQDKK